MSDVQLIGFLKTALIPCAVTLLTLIAVWQPWRRARRAPKAAVPVAICAGFIAGSVAILGGSGLSGVQRHVWPPDPTRRMVAYALIALGGAGLAGALSGPGRARLAARLGVRALTMGAIATVLFSAKIRLAWTAGESIVAVGAATLVGVVWWNAIGVASTRRPGGWTLATLAALAGGSAPLLFGAGHAALAQEVAMLGGVLAVCALTAFLRPALGESPGIGGVVAGLLLVLWGCGAVYSSDPMPPASLVLLGAAPLAVLARVAPGVRSWSGWRAPAAGVLTVALGLLILGGALGAQIAARGSEDGPNAAPTSGDWESMMGP